MACRDVCARERVKHPGHTSTRYARGLGYCRACEAWFRAGAPAGVSVPCPCCRQRLRRVPSRGAHRAIAGGRPDDP